MNKHHLRYFLRQWIEHTNPANLRLHTWINGIGWLALTTLLSQIPTPVGLPILGANAGAWFVALSTLYWMPVDLLVSGLLASLSLAWASLPFAPWGPGHGWIAGVLLPLVVFTTTGLTALYAHIYYHEHAVFMNGDAPLSAALETAHAVIWGAHHFWLQRLLRAGYRPALRALLDAREREALLRREAAPWSNWSGTVSCRPGLRCVPQSVQDLVDVVREAAVEGRRVRVVASGFSWSAFWLRTFDRTERPLSFAGHGLVFLGMNFVQHLFLIGVSRFVERFARRHTPLMSRFKFEGLTFGERVLTLPDAVHYRRWIELVRCGCIEVGFKVDDDFGSFQEAFQVAQRLCEAYARRGLFPLNLTLNVRFIGPSSALLSPAYGAGLTCYIEALCVDRSAGWTEFSAELCGEWLKIPGALPHWAKEFEHVPGVYPLSQEHLGDRRRRFLDAWIESRVDPRRMFVNPLIASLLGDEAAGRAVSLEAQRLDRIEA